MSLDHGLRPCHLIWHQVALPVQAGEVAGLEARLRVALSQQRWQAPASRRSSLRAEAFAPAAPTWRVPGRDAAQKAAAASSTANRTAEPDSRDASGSLPHYDAGSAVAEVADAVQRDKVAAAQREAEFERLQREAAEDAAAEALETVEKLREKLQGSQREVRSLQERLNAAVAERRQQPNAELTKLQVALVLAIVILRSCTGFQTAALQASSQLQPCYISLQYLIALMWTGPVK